MKRVLLFALLLVILLLIGSGASGETLAEAGDPVDQDDEGWVIIDTSDTPLAKAIESSHQKPEGKDKRQLEKEKTLDVKNNNARIVETKTTLDYLDPTGFPDDGQKVKNGKWINRLAPPSKWNQDWKSTPVRPGAYNQNRGQGTEGIYTAILPDAANNDDTDCVDMVTGVHRGGVGKAGECYADWAGGDYTLVATLVQVDSPDGSYCQHTDDPNITYPLDECEAMDWTTLMETIDEDGVEEADADGDGLIDEDGPDGVNDDGDCMGSVLAGQDEQGQDVYELQQFAAEDCTDADGNPIEGRYPLIDEDGSEPVDNDGDDQYDEDGPGAPGNMIGATAADGDPFEEQCRAYYAELDVPFSDEDYSAELGCDLDSAMIQSINKKAEQEHGKWVFKDPKSDLPNKEQLYSWKGESLEGPVIEYTFVKPGQYAVELAVADDSGASSSCSMNVVVNKAGGKEKDKDCPADLDPPITTFALNSCDEDLKCEFEASGTAGSDLTYQWSLGKSNAGQHGNSQGKGQAFNKGDEQRRMTVSETMVVRCQPGWTYVEKEDTAGKKVRCVKASTQSTLLAAPTGTPLLAGDSVQQSSYAMMGFTFAPPVIEWGWKIEEEVCIFGWCFEVFYARIGYQFDLAAGLRLPVQVDVSTPAAIDAEESMTFEARLTAVDFDRSDYEEFCEQHDLDSLPYIGNCQERFSFPNFLDSSDGDEFVANYHVFAGVIVRVLRIPIINWGINAGVDLAQACTMFNLYSALQDPDAGEIFDLVSGAIEGDPAGALKDLGWLCGSFTTPFGFDEDSVPKSFPFIPAAFSSFELRADCAEALARNEIVMVGGYPVPLCTGLILGVPGASLGIGLGIEVLAGSEQIRADWSTRGDAMPGPGANTAIEWYGPTEPDVTAEATMGPVVFDNYDLTRDLEHDIGIVEVDDFEYCLNIWVNLYARLMFGGILSPIPDLAEFSIYSFSFGDIAGGCALPLPQHPGTEALQFEIPVNNYGLEVTAEPEAQKVPDPVSKGSTGDYQVMLTNLGSLSGTFDNFWTKLTNVPDQSPPYDYFMDPDNDGDGQIDEDGPAPQVCRLNPSETGCNVDDDGDGLIDEDPADDQWTATFGTNVAGPVNPYLSAAPVTLTVTPFQHGMTRPGLYPVQVLADSVEARSKPLASLFPADPASFSYEYDVNQHVYGRHTEVFDVVFIDYQSFFQPNVLVTPESASAKPGVPVEYSGTFSNGGNEEDTISVVTSTVDWNTAGCTLTTMGGQAGCPYRAVPSVISPEWLVDGFSADVGPLAPCTGDQGTATLTAPADWAGMTDTNYEFVVSAQSHGDPGATATFSTTYTIQATKESMTRYIGLEIAELLAELESANAAELRTCGLRPIVLHPVQLQNDRALELILSGKQDQASNSLAAAAHIVEGAYLHALDGCAGKLPEEQYLDWRLRGEMILADLILAAESTIASAP